MLHFRIRQTVQVEHLIAGSAALAIRSEIAKGAHAGAELFDDAGDVIARKHRIEFDGGWIVAWVPTSAWPDLEPPVSLDGLLDLVDEDGGVAS